jgi:hypothetical protein
LAASGNSATFKLRSVKLMMSSTNLFSDYPPLLCELWNVERQIMTEARGCRAGVQKFFGNRATAFCILDAVRATWIKLRSEGQQMLGVAVKRNVVATAIWRPGFVHPWVRWAGNLRLSLVEKTKFKVHMYTAWWSGEYKGCYTASG